MDSKGFGEVAVKLTHNPLGIIGLTLVFIEWFGTTIFESDKLPADLVPWVLAFLILFPLFNVGCFIWILKNGYGYAPSDFASDENFLRHYGLESGTKTITELKAKQFTRPAMEYKILNTLWTKQVNLYPKYDGVWTFRIHANTPAHVPFREAALKLLQEGLVSETNEGQLYLTGDGFVYCQNHYKNFPSDQFWPEETITEEKLKIALETKINQ